MLRILIPVSLRVDMSTFAPNWLVTITRCAGTCTLVSFSEGNNVKVRGWSPNPTELSPPQ